VRIAFGTAWKVALFAELYGAPSGLGYVISIAQQNSDTVTVFAAILVIVVIVFVTQLIVFDRLERVLFRQRRAGAVSSSS
jgi:NitT/TauT family transport system permease protein/sulfonate transport system permease protein